MDRIYGARIKGDCNKFSVWSIWGFVYIDSHLISTRVLRISGNTGYNISWVLIEDGDHERNTKRITPERFSISTVIEDL